MATERIGEVKINFDTATNDELLAIRQHQVDRLAGTIGDLAIIDTYLTDRGYGDMVMRVWTTPLELGNVLLPEE